MRRRRGGTEGRTPAVLLTGFLGSGKTTLVNRLLKTQSFSRSAVVVNEYGEVSVDHVLIDAPRRRMRVVDGGCLCGHVHEEVATSLLDLHAGRANDTETDFDTVLIETSGLADPVPIIQILVSDSEVTSAYELRGVITVADGVQGLRQLELNQESVKQAAVADTLFISKTDLANKDALAALSTRLRGINPGARQICSTYGDLDPLLVSTNGYRADMCSTEARSWLQDDCYTATTPACPDFSITTFAMEYATPISVPGLVLWLNLLAGFRGAGLLRVKGIVNVEGRPFVIQAVQRVISEPAPLDRWPPDSDKRSRLVFITRGMNADDIRRTFASFSFDSGREPRNVVINPEHYECFRNVLETFRNSRLTE